MKKHFAVAVDGPSGAGKSTLSRAVAKELGILYVDTGAIYRTVGYHTFSKGLSLDEAGEKVTSLLDEIHIEMRYGADGLQRMYLNGADVTDEIRLPQISMYASCVSALPEVRAFLLEMQRRLARENSVIMDGRDIGTVVLPDAEVKIFLTASAQVRAKRRCAELEARGTSEPYEEVLRQIEQRDYNDTHRAAAPLRKADDAVTVDTTKLTFEESRDAIICVIRERIGK
ncbi:MAG: (d)CMP kinase [Oscillospiraceae bacterium]|nr:(d)CMP kinase [Oscillospiraceae bacterium]